MSFGRVCNDNKRVHILRLPTFYTVFQAQYGIFHGLLIAKANSTRIKGIFLHISGTIQSCGEMQFTEKTENMIKQ